MLPLVAVTLIGRDKFKQDPCEILAWIWCIITIRIEFGLTINPPIFFHISYAL